MADCEEVFSCLDCIGLAGSSVDVGSNACIVEQHASFQAVDADWPDWEVDLDLHRNLPHHSDDPCQLEFNTGSQSESASDCGFLESTGSGLLPTSYRYYNHGRIAVSESYKSPVSKAFDEELQNFFAMGNIRTNYHPEINRVHSDQISGLLLEESTTEEILFTSNQGENQTTSSASALCGADLGQEKSEHLSNDLEEKGHEPTDTTQQSETVSGDRTPRSPVSIMSSEQQPIPSLSERVGITPDCSNSGTKFGLIGGGSRGETKKFYDSLALDLFREEREVDSDGEQEMKEVEGSHRPSSTKKNEKDIIRIKEGPTIRSLGKGSSKSSSIPTLVHTNENKMPTKEVANDCSNRSSAPFEECQKNRTMGAANKKISDSPPKIGQNLANPVKALDGCLKQNEQETEVPSALLANRSRVGATQAPLDTISRSQKLCSKQASNVQNENLSHPSWKTMSTLGSETEVSDEPVLIEVEQFDPIARENVWIPGTVLHNYKKGKFKAILTDKYGDQVISQIFEANFFQITEARSSSGRKPSISISLCWRFAPLPEEACISPPKTQPERTVEYHQVEVDVAKKEKTRPKGMKMLASATKGRGNGHRLCKECKFVHHYRSACRTEPLNKKRELGCSADSPDRRSLGITPFRKKISSRKDEFEDRVSSAARKSICFGDNGGLAGMMRERRDWSGFVGRVFGLQGEENGSFVEEQESKAEHEARSCVKRK